MPGSISRAGDTRTPIAGGWSSHARKLAEKEAQTVSTLYQIFVSPFTEFEFMRRALAGALALALGACPIGVFLMLRRMSLVGDAMAHAILPGAAVGFLLSGLNLFAMTAGGLIAGFVGSKIVNRQGQGFWLDIALGIVGALVGGFLFDLFGASGISGLNIYSMIVAIVGSIVVLLIYNALMGRRRA
jgi:uncharacterized membrane protein YeaQ/YmgE (transglycosylase-associated protein family)